MDVVQDAKMLAEIRARHNAGKAISPANQLQQAQDIEFLLNLVVPLLRQVIRDAPRIEALEGGE